MTPKQVERLEKTLGRVAREQGLDQERHRRWVSFLALCGVLESAVEKSVIDIYPCFVFHSNFDPDSVCQFHLVLFGLKAGGELVKADLQYFRKSPNTFRAVASKTRSKSLVVRAALAKRSSIATPPFTWQTIEVDLGPGEAREVDLVTPAIEGVAEMGLPNQVRCLGINEQVAQKLHACTGPQRQDRARDILDILVVDMLGQLDRVRTRAAAAERIFGERNTHPFPPETNIPPEWHIEIETLAAELGYRTTKAAEIQKGFTDLVAAIASA